VPGGLRRNHKYGVFWHFWRLRRRKWAVFSEGFAKKRRIWAGCGIRNLPKTANERKTPDGDSHSEGKTARNTGLSLLPPVAPLPESVFSDKPLRLTAKPAFFPVSQFSKKGATGEVRPNSRPEAAKSAFSDPEGCQQRKRSQILRICFWRGAEQPGPGPGKPGFRRSRKSTRIVRLCFMLRRYKVSIQNQ
jgi:hypothetical protein